MEKSFDALSVLLWKKRLSRSFPGDILDPINAELFNVEILLPTLPYLSENIGI